MEKIFPNVSAAMKNIISILFVVPLVRIPKKSEKLMKQWKLYSTFAGILR